MCGIVVRDHEVRNAALFADNLIIEVERLRERGSMDALDSRERK